MVAVLPFNPGSVSITFKITLEGMSTESGIWLSEFIEILTISPSFKNKELSNLTVCFLDRSRHKEINDTLDKLRINKKLITDGDVSGALYVTDNKFNVDMFVGIGGGPEGVLAASALDASNCFFQGRFIFDNDKDIYRAKQMGIVDLTKKYNLKEIVKGDSIFCATGITSGELVKGISLKDNNYITQTLVTHKSSNTCKIVTREDTIKTW